MTPTEAVALCRATKAACPQQQFDQWTPDAWHSLLEDIEITEATAAMFEVAKRQPFVAPAEIRAEVRRARALRVKDYGPLPLPPARIREIEDGPEFNAAYQQWVREATVAISQGREPETDEPEALEHPTRAVIETLRKQLTSPGARTADNHQPLKRLDTKENTDEH